MCQGTREKVGNKSGKDSAKTKQQGSYDIGKEMGSKVVCKKVRKELMKKVSKNREKNSARKIAEKKGVYKNIRKKTSKQLGQKYPRRKRSTSSCKGVPEKLFKNNRRNQEKMYVRKTHSRKVAINQATQCVKKGLTNYSRNFITKVAGKQAVKYATKITINQAGKNITKQ